MRAPVLRYSVFLFLALQCGCAGIDRTTAEHSPRFYVQYVNTGYDEDALSGNDLAVHVNIVLENRSKSAQCFHADQFEEGPGLLALRVYEGGTLLRANTERLPSRTYHTHRGSTPSRVGIIPPATTRFFPTSIHKIYRIEKGHTYRFEYSLPLTPCDELLQKDIDIPSVGSTWMYRLDFNADNPEDLKEIIRFMNPEWSEIGSFLELEPHEELIR